MRPAADRIVVRAALGSVLLAVAVASSPMQTAAQAPPDSSQRWDGLIERLSTPGPWNPESFSNPRMSRHALSHDGRYFIFGADVPNGPYPPTFESFIRDRMTGETQLSGPGSQNGPPVLSADGNHRALEACNIEYRPDGPPICDVYVLDQRTWMGANMSTALDGTISTDHSSEPMLSRDGRFVVFRTNSPTLLPPGGSPGQIVLRDRDTDGNGIFDEPGYSSIRIVSVSATGEPGNQESASAEVSADGRFVAFRSRANNLVPNDSNGTWDVFLHDTVTGQTRRINVGWDGQEATPTVDSPAITMSEDGRFVAFAADDWYLTDPPAALFDDNNALDVYVFDGVADTLSRVDIGEGGTLGNGHTYWPSLSADGRYLAVVSTSTNVANPGTPGRAHVFVYDRATSHATRVSINPDGTEPDRDCAYPTISADGSVVTFISQATNLPTSAPPNTDTLYAAVHFAVTPGTLTIPARGGEVSATVTAQQYVRWEASLSEWSWLTAGSTGFWGTGSGVASFRADRNPDPTARTITATLKSKTITITQEAGLNIVSATPLAGPASGGTLVTITGTGFEPDMHVYFDGSPAQAVEFVDTTTLRAVTPPHPPGEAWFWVLTSDESWGAGAMQPFRYADVTPPELRGWAEGTQTPDGWFTTDVQIGFNYWDPDSNITGVDGCLPVTLRTDTPGTTYSCTVTSEGGTATTSVSVKRDTTPPSVLAQSPQQTVYGPGADPGQVAYTCSDALTGVVECNGPAQGSPVDVTPGYHQFGVIVRDGAGNMGYQTFNYLVATGGCAPRPDGLVSWFPFETIGGSTPQANYVDAVSGAAATPVNTGDQFEPGAAGTFAMAGNGVSSYVSAGTSEAFRHTDAFTLAAWVKPGASSGQVQVIAGREGEYMLAVFPDGSVRWSVAASSIGSDWRYFGAILQPGVWTHLALTYGGSTVSTYVNGLQTSGAWAPGPIVDASPDLNDFRIGAREDPVLPSYFAGAIDDVMVASRALTSSEVSTIVNAAGDSLCGPRATTVTVEPDPVTVGYGQVVNQIFTITVSSEGQAVAGRRVLFFDPTGYLLLTANTGATGEVQVGAGVAGSAIGSKPGFEARFLGDFNYAAASARNVVNVTRGVPAITWTPAPLRHPTPLGPAQLDATASAPGTFTYTPAAGTVLPVGTHTLAVRFDPADPTVYEAATATRTITVLDGSAPIITPVVEGTLGANGWYTSDVRIAFTVQDQESAITSMVGCGTTVVTADIPETGFTCSAISEGGTAEMTYFLKRDATPPLISLRMPEPTLYEATTASVARYSCSDGLSGAAACAGPVPTETAFDLTPGYHTFAVQAADAAGNVTSKQVTYAIGNGACEPRPADFVAWWPFEVPSPTYSGFSPSYRDVVSGTEATPVNTDWRFSRGPVGEYAMSTANLWSYVNAGARPDLRLTGPFSIAVWAFPTAEPGDVGVIAGREGEYLLARFPDGTLRYSLATATPGWGWIDTGAQLRLGVWSHVILTYDGSFVTAYINGRSVFERATSGPIGDAASSMNEFRIGARQDQAGPPYFIGGIDDLQVYARVLDPVQIERIFLAGTEGLCGPRPVTFEVIPNPVDVKYGETKQVELVARVSDAGTPVPGRQVTIRQYDRLLGSGLTDANGEFRVTDTVTGQFMGLVYWWWSAEHTADVYTAGSTISVSLLTEKGTPTIVWAAPAPIVYGTPLGGAQLNAIASTSGVFAYDPPADAVLSAGTHTLSTTFTPTNTANYTTAGASVPLDVFKATPFITLSAPSAVYDGLPHGATGTVTGAGGAPLGPLTFTYNGSPEAPIDAGTYDVVAGFAGDGNHEAASATATLTIAKATVAVTASGGTYTYDGTAHAATGTVTGVGGAPLGPLTFTYNGSPEAPIDAGTYDVVAGFAGDSNHQAASATATLTITKATAVVRWTAPGAITYGTPLGAAQLNATASTAGTFAYSPAAGTVLPAGSGHGLSVTFTPADPANYGGASAATAIDVAPAPLIIRANDAAKRFGAPLPPLTASYTGFVNGDSAASLTGTLVLTTSATQQSPVGVYPIVPSGVSSTNYAIAFASGSLSVIRGRVSVAISTLPEPSGWDQPMTFTAIVSAAAPSAGNPAGIVRFFDGVTLLGVASLSGGSATLSTAGLDPGGRTIEVQYEGDGSFEPGAGSSPHTVQDPSHTPVLSVASSKSSTHLGQSVTLTATVSLASGPVSGVVEFYDGATPLATAAIASGRASFTTSSLGAGSHAIVARFPGSAGVPPSRSDVLVQAVGAPGWKDRPTSLAITATPNPTALGDAVVIVAEVSGGSGAPVGRILFMVDGAVVADVPAVAASGTTSRAVLSVPGLAHGRHIVSATYLGDPAYEGSTGRVTVSVN